MILNANTFLYKAVVYGSCIYHGICDRDGFLAYTRGRAPKHAKSSRLQIQPIYPKIAIPVIVMIPHPERQT